MTNTQNFPVATELSIPDALNRAYAHWNAGQADQAEQYCQRVLAAWPGQADALHLMGVMAHAYGNLDLAVAHLRQACLAPRAPAVFFSNLAEMCRQKGLLAEGEQAGQRAVTLDPKLSDAWNNLGIILQESGKLDASLNCLERVVALQPASPEAHNNLANTYRRLDRPERAQFHYQQALTLNPGYAEAHSNMAFLLSAQGQVDQAAAAARHAIELNPRLVDAYLNLADIESARVRHDEALRWIDALLSFAPQHAGGLAARAQILRKMDRTDEALAHARQALTLAPDNASAHNTLGQILQALGMFDEALAAFDRAAALPGTVVEEALVARAALFLENGRKEEAVAAFDRALAAFPDSLRALVARAESKTFKADDPDIAAMEAGLAQQADGLLQADRMSAHFALGKAYLDSGDSVRAFHHLDTGNRIKRSTFTYDAAATGRWFNRIAAAFTPEFQAKRQGAGAASELPVFIIGMPRSGTTLVEQILASHPQVHGAGELGALSAVIASAGDFPGNIGNCSTDDLSRLGRDYLARIAPLANGKARLVDKMPANFFFAGMIPLILSGARIIHCRRDPVDTCLSCYSKQFAGEQLFSYDQAELGQFHRDYQTLMAHWRTVLPAASFIEVDYESVVDDLEGQARRLIDFIDLPWDDACLNFHQTRRVVRTASVNQVRQPIYKTSKGRWQAHADHLRPLLAALGIEN
jgi:tetratricopeptide (TPR) repeat protein